MAIPSEITALIARLNDELDRTEQEARQGLNLARQILSRFPDNASVIQFFADLNTVVLFGENSRGRIETVVQSISSGDVPAEVIQERGEYLATLLGVVLEVRIELAGIITRLSNFL